MVRTERGQLMLVGAILIALIFIGFSVVLNSVVYTETVAGGSSIEVTGDVNEFNKEARRNARILTIRVNHQGNYSNFDTINSNLESNFTEYSRLLSESYADTGSVYVNVSYDGNQTDGNRIVQDVDQNYQKGGSSNWFAFDSDNKDIGWFLLNVDVENTSQSTQSRIKIADTSGSTLTVSVKQSESARLLVNSSVDGSHITNSTCQPENGRVLLDLVEGSSSTSSCSFNATGKLDPPYDSVKFENADAIQGKYSLVVNQTSGLGFSECSTGDKPCKMPAVWEISITSRYQSSSISYQNSQNLTVYE